jgi:hypothetical protein
METLWVGVCCFVCACGASDAQQKRCDDVTQQIEEALAANIDNGVLYATAAPCALSAESFDSRVDAESRDYLMEAFSNACDRQAESCGDVHRVPPPSDPPPPPSFETPRPVPN